MIALTDQSKLTQKEYLAAEEQSLVKHEYIDGKVYAMAGTTDNHDYQALASLEEYVLVSSQHQRVEIFRRKHQFWQYQTYDLDQPNFKLETIGLDVKIADIYEDVVLESMSENPPP